MKLITKPVSVSTEQMVDTGIVCSACHARFAMMHGFPVYCRRCYPSVRGKRSARCATKLRADDPIIDMVRLVIGSEMHKCIVEGCEAMIRREFVVCSADRQRVPPSLRRKLIAAHRELDSYDEDAARRYVELVQLASRQVSKEKKCSSQ